MVEADSNRAARVESTVMRRAAELLPIQREIERKRFEFLRRPRRPRRDVHLRIEAGADSDEDRPFAVT